MNKQYSFKTVWRLKAPVKEVWDTIYESERWPEWWSNVLEVHETVKGDDNGIGSIREYTLRSPMHYTLFFRLTLTDRVDYQLLKGNASGELDGTGSWHFREADGVTTVECLWNVSTTVWWMNSFAFILKPLFRLNHSLVMKSGGICLARKLNAEMI
ncbi:MAG: SRPBCC family protein [Bacteroidetes bacterium]|nr:SRPBCC family protein [Bacteroidota bacterium]